ncbi:MAG: hypothetical protein ACOCTL_03535 [Candidatus Hadarchaeota archaeon]
MVRLSQRGVSDIIVVVVMFILIVISSAVILGRSSDTLDASSRRKDELRMSYLYRTLNKSEVAPGVSPVRAIAEQVVLENPSVNENYLRHWLENTFDFLSARGRGTELVATYGNENWKLRVPESASASDNITFRGTFGFGESKGEVLEVDILFRTFELDNEF